VIHGRSAHEGPDQWTWTGKPISIAGFRRLSLRYGAGRGRVRCAVTRRALSAVAALHCFDRDEPLVVYRALKARIQAIAQEKYRKRLEDEDGVVVVRRRDLEAV
jgi:hypothetical protein